MPDMQTIIPTRVSVYLLIQGEGCHTNDVLKLKNKTKLKHLAYLTCESKEEDKD